MATALSCAAANDLLARNDSLFGAWIHEQNREKDIWGMIVPSKPFPVGAGYTHRSIMIEGMTTGSAEDDWTAVTASAGGVINPLSAPTINDVNWGQSYTNWSPYYKSYKTPCIALDDLRFDHEVATQLKATVNMLSELTSEWNSNRARYEAARLMPQVSSRPGFGPNGIVGVTDTTKMIGKAGVVQPTATLAQSQLDEAYEYLLAMGSGQESSRANIADGMPILTLITSRTTSDKIIREAGTSGNNNGIRDDFHYGNAGELLKPLGVSRVFRGFAHVCDVELPRFDYVAGAYVRRLKWTSEATDSGYKRTLNTAWNTAAYELNYIMPKDCYNKRVINPFEREIAGASFEDRPEYYNAQFFWHNVKDNTTNVFGKIGKFVGLSANASEPVFPKRGLTILSKRCAYDQSFPACTCAA